MRKFYAVYDNEDNFISCGFSAKELGMSAIGLFQCLHRNKGKTGLKVYEIPLIPQKDVFQEEDLLFLQEEGENIFTNSELAEKQGISIREFYRRRAYCERSRKSY